MDNIIDVAAYIVKKYAEMTGEILDEMKLHKLLYFTQRESFAITGEPAFIGEFEGWKYGPVCREVRSSYYDGNFNIETKGISSEIQYIANNVIIEYGKLASWKLSELSHRDTAWKNARIGLKSSEMGNVPIKNEDIRQDAMKIRPYDHMWDMYYDEFDDEESAS